MDKPSETFASKVLIATGIVALVVVLLLLVAQVVLVFMLIFGGILIALFLRALSDPLAAHTPLSPAWALAIVVTLLTVTVGLGLWWLAPEIAIQIDQLTQQLPRALQKLGERLARYPWMQRLLEQLPPAGDIRPAPGIVSRLTSVVSVTVAWIVGVIVVIFIGVYLAAQPRLYVNGIIRLFPLSRRARMTEVGGRLAHALRMWLLARLILMIVVTVFTGLGLVLLDVPLALALGLIAGLLDFIPNIGPTLAAIPATIIGLARDPTTGLYVLLLFIVIQTIEGYILTPLILQRTAAVPAAITLAAQVLLGLLLGFVGLLLAAPITIAARVLVEELYIRDTLGDRDDA